MTEAAIGYAANVAPELSDQIQPIGSVKRHPKNIREHNIPAIAESLQYHGQRTPIVVQKSSMLIVKGNGTHEAAELLGWDGIAMLVQDMDDEAALKYLIADNRASDLAKTNAKKGRALLEEMVGGPGLFGTLFSDEDFADMADPISRPVAEFKGDYADAGEEAAERATKAKREGAKMKEIPVVLTAADHAVFIGNLTKLQKEYGLTGYRATIVEAVRRAVEGTGASGDLVDRKTMLKEIRDWFSNEGSPTWSMGKIMAFFQSQMHAIDQAAKTQRAEAAVAAERAGETPVAEGQMSMLDQLA